MKKGLKRCIIAIALILLLGTPLVVSAVNNSPIQITPFCNTDQWGSCINTIPNRVWAEERRPFSGSVAIEVRVHSTHNTREHRAVGHVNGVDVISPWRSSHVQSTSEWHWSHIGNGHPVMQATR